MDIIGKIKEKLGMEEERKYSMPPEYLLVRWREEKGKYNIFGESGKEIIWVKNGKGYRAFPYSSHLIKNLKAYLQLAIFDMTEGKSEPDVDLADSIDPGKIEVRGL